MLTSAGCNRPVNVRNDNVQAVGSKVVEEADVKNEDLMLEFNKRYKVNLAEQAQN